LYRAIESACRTSLQLDLGAKSRFKGSMASFTVEQKVGRLVEARVFRLSTRADVEDYGRAFAPFANLRPAAVLMADHRPARVYSPEVAQDLVTMFEGLNRVWEKAALLVSPNNATLAIQLQRLVRESRNESRRVFLDQRECEVFLSTALDEAGRSRLQTFLSQPLGDG
jgi:hypothetical protein